MTGAISIMIVILVLGIAVDMIFTRVDTTIRRRRGMLDPAVGVMAGPPAPPAGRQARGGCTERTIESMSGTAGIVLAGGRSSRMGTAKAALEWHGSTLLRRTVGILARVTDGPVVVVRAPGQDLPALPAQVEIVDDPREGLGPVQGIAAGLAALDRPGRGRVCQLDRHAVPASRVRAAGAAGGAGRGRCRLPVARGYPQPLAASYRVALAPVAAKLVAEERLRPAFLFEECAVDRLDEAALRADPVLAALDPGLDSVVNVNEPADYQAARARPAPEVTIQRFGPLADGHRGPEQVLAATVAEAADAAGLELDAHVVAALNGDQITRDGETPLAAGDTCSSCPRTQAADPMAAGGYFGQALVVDASSGTAYTLPLPDELLRAYIGGAGLGTWLMHRLAPPGADPLSPAAPLAFVFSPLVGTPLTTSAKFAVVAKSPLTGMLNDALSSSHFAISGKLTGHDAIVVHGACERPSVLLVDGAGARFTGVADLWGLSAAEAETRLRERLGRGWRVAAIGPAGERGVRYATISHDGRHAGRGGLGAVLGAKRIKAVAVRAATKVAPAAPGSGARRRA